MKTELYQSTKCLSELCSLKFKILCEGVTLSNNFLNSSKRIKGPSYLRSGLSSGLDIVLPKKIWVNAAIKEQYARNSNFVIDYQKGKYFLKDNQNNIEIAVTPEPQYYSRKASDGTLLKNIGTLRGDRLSIAVGKYCDIWNNEKFRCKFCAIGATSKNEPKTKPINQIIELLNYSLYDPIVAAKHVYLNAGNQGTVCNGFNNFTQIIKKIKETFGIHVHLNPCPPKEEKYINMIYDVGLDEISFNIDVFDPERAKIIIPAKHKMRELYIKMLKYAVKVFGFGNVSSCLVVGMEDIDSTIKGVDFLCSIGVVPKLSCFRPLVGSALEHITPPSYKFIMDVYFRVKELCKRWDVPLGPLCYACQLHSIVCPDDSELHERETAES